MLLGLGAFLGLMALGHIREDGFWITAWGVFEFLLAISIGYNAFDKLDSATE